MIQQIEVYGVPYKVTHPLPKKSSKLISSYSVHLENFLGIDGLDALTRANSYGDPCGYVDSCMLEVTKETISLNFVHQEHCDRQLENVLEFLVKAYPSVGWECLTQ